VAYNDAGTGLEAWLVSSNSQGHYFRSLTDAQKRVALENGWTLTMIAKTFEGASFAGVDFTGRSAFFIMESEVVNGKIKVMASNELVPKYDFTTAFLNLDGMLFHEFRMTYDPVSRSAQIFVDGKLVITGYRGMRQFQDDRGVDFGCERFDSQRAKAAFKLVRLEIHRQHPNGS
jgi:hypothetical protein